jgi:uncharacterized protein (TIGR02145 family)
MPDGKRWTRLNLSADLPASYCYDDNPSNCARYGRLYTWAAAGAVCDSLGSGWRLPSIEDWKMLAKIYGGLFGDGQGNGTIAFQELLVGGRSGLELRLGGGRDDHQYARLEAHGFYWSASQDSATTAHYLNFAKGNRAMYDQKEGEKTRAFSVRCVTDGR